MESFKTLLLKVNYYVINPLIGLLFAISLVVFIVGVIEFLQERDSSSQKSNDGKQHLLWGLVGMFIMISVFGIMNLLKNAIGSDIQVP